MSNEKTFAHRLRHRVPASGLAAMLFLLAGCAAAPDRIGEAPAEASQATQAEAQGNWDRAAMLWEQAAAGAEGQAAADFRLSAAEAWIRAGQPQRGLDLARALEATALADPQEGRLALLRAELAIEADDPERAEFYLDAAALLEHPDDAARAASLRARLRKLMDDPAGRALADAASLVERAPAYDAVLGMRILRILEDVPSGRLAEVAKSPGALAGWAGLALSIRRTLISRSDLSAAARIWAGGHPDHSVGVDEYLELAWQYGQWFTPPGRIAVLLPFDGSLEAAAGAIRDGLVAALQDRPANSELTFMAVDDDPQSAVNAYRQAAREEHQWVIGPLRREAVQALSSSEVHPVPALMLNQPLEPADSPFKAGATLYDLSLSQEAEAQALARRMLDLELHRVIVLIAGEPWADKMFQAFSEAFISGGGEIVDQARFDAALADHSETLTVLLRIEDSRVRKDELQAAIGLPLEFEPTRRDDFEAIFMAADPVLGRQLKPQLRFYDAGAKPVYAMNRVFSGRIDPAADQDLDGVTFGGTRWALGAWDDPHTRALFSLRGGQFGALFALGRDAWNVLPWLELMGKDPDLAFPGATGRWRLRDGSHVEREPIWLRFEGGRPVAAEDPGEE